MLFISFFFFVPNCFGQDEKKSIELKVILDEIAQQYNVKFNYTEEDIRHSIFPPEKSMPLRAKLVYIANRTGLHFKENGNYIAIYTNPRPLTKKICAYVLDEFSQPVDNAVIQYFPQNKTIVTGSDGYFELPINYAEKLYIEHLGYAPVSIKLNDDNSDCLQIVLQLAVTELEEVVAERYLTTGISKKKDGSFVIKPKKFGILPGLIEPDVLNTMLQLPGVNSIDETVSNINVRGGTHDQNLFMWNGIRLFQTGHFFGLISALNPNLAHEIRIAKNGTSALYGESVSSAVDITSRPAEIGETTGSVGANMISVDGYARIKTSETANFEVSARRSFTDILAFPTYNNYSKRIFQNTVITELNNSTDVNYKSDKEFYFYDFTAQYHQKIGEKHNFYVDFIGINNKLDFTQGTITGTNVITKVSNLSQQTFGGTAAWKAQWNENHSSQVNIHSSYYDLDGQNESIEYSQITRQENKILDNGISLEDSQRLNPVFVLHSGYQYNEIGITNTDQINEPQYSRKIKEVLRTHALVAEMEYEPENQKIYARAGLRVNYIEQFSMAYLEPRLQLNYNIDNRWKIELLAEQKSQSVSQVVELQADFLGIEKRRWILANDKDIPVQKSNQISLGGTYKEKGWMISLENFYKKVNGITTDGQGFQDRLELLHLPGSYTVYGTEFLAQKQFNHFYTWLSYTWNNNNYTFDAFTPQKFASNFEIRHTINSAAIYEWNNLKIALGSKWFTGRPYTPPLLSVPTFTDSGVPFILYNFPNSANLANFFQVNFSASYTWNLPKNTRLQAGISVLNVFNRKNIINRYYRLNSSSDGIEQVDTYSIERTPNALIKFMF